MTEQRKFTVLITGFGPWEGFPINESSVCVQNLWNLDWPSNIRLITRELPVVYDVVSNEVPKLWDEFKPDLTVHCGISGQATSICIEKQSFNEGYCRVDICGKIPNTKCCKLDGEHCLQTQLDTSLLCDEVNKDCQRKGLIARCTESMDPGQYLCGFTYYISLNRDNSRSLFVHIPVEDVYSVNEKTIALQSIILNALQQLFGAE